MTDQELLLAISDIMDKKIKSELQPVRDELKMMNDNIQQRIDSLEVRVNSIELHLENVTDRNIQLLAEN